MPAIPAERYDELSRLIRSMEDERRPWWEYWRLIAEFLMPRRYTWLQSTRERTSKQALDNSSIINNTGTIAARTLASGMMNGITSPARPWFRLRAPGYRDSSRVTRWLQSAQEDMLFAMGESNYYSALAIQYLDLATFQTSWKMIYEDDEEVFRAYNFPLGEYYFAQGPRMTVDRVAREFTRTVEQVVREFGLENCSKLVRDNFKLRGKGLNELVRVCHIVEPNDTSFGDLNIPRAFKYREIYWDKDDAEQKALRIRGFYEWPGSAARWEIMGNDPYGVGPTSDALGDIRQLQHMEKRKLQALDKLVSPPIVADIQLQNRPMALLPNGITYVSGVNNVGVKPIYTVQPPLGEISQEIKNLEIRISETYHNDLFRMISQLDTVRSATEIDARREEKLILLGPVLDRFQGEVLDSDVKRIFGIMYRNGLFAPPPPEIKDQEAMIEYDSILSDARRALDAAPIERGAAFIGNLAGAVPDVLQVPDWIETTRDYLRKIGWAEKNMRPPEEVAASIEQQRQAAMAEQMANTAQPAAQSAKLLSETPVGGADSALGLLLGNR